MTVNYSLSFVSTTGIILVIDFFGLIGSVLIGIVLFQKDMRSSYNYNLLGLCLSDGMLLILSALWCFDNLEIISLSTYYPLSSAIFICDWIFTGGTKYFTVAIALERYLVVCHPLKSRGWITNNRAKIFALSVFLFVIILAIWSYFYDFYFDWKNSFEIYAAIVLHFSPFLAVVILNFLIFQGLQKYEKQRKLMTESEVSELSITRMLLAVVFVFGFCYSFEFIRRILNFAGYFDFDKYQYYDYLICRLADIFYALNSSANFIIYYLMGNKFKCKFRDIFDKSCCCKRSEG